MHEISAKDWELLGLFEHEPERQGLDPVWLLDDSAYKAVQGEVEFTFAIHPYHRDVRLMLCALGNKIYEYSAMGVKDIEVRGDALHIMIDAGETIVVTVRPSLNIRHKTAN